LFGFSFLGKFQKKGLAFESVSALVNLTRKRNPSIHFHAGAALDNTPSMNLLKRLGFRLVSTEVLAFHRDKNGEPIFFKGGNFIL